MLHPIPIGFVPSLRLIAPPPAPPQRASGSFRRECVTRSRSAPGTTLQPATSRSTTQRTIFGKMCHRHPRIGFVSSFALFPTAPGMTRPAFDFPANSVRPILESGSFRHFMAASARSYLPSPTTCLLTSPLRSARQWNRFHPSRATLSRTAKRNRESLSVDR